MRGASPADATTTMENQMRITRKLIECMILDGIKNYENAAKRKYDPDNGTSQIPEGNMDAAVAYGELEILKRLIWD